MRLDNGLLNLCKVYRPLINLSLCSWKLWIAPANKVLVWFLERKEIMCVTTEVHKFSFCTCLSVEVASIEMFCIVCFVKVMDSQSQLCCCITNKCTGDVYVRWRDVIGKGDVCRSVGQGLSADVQFLIDAFKRDESCKQDEGQKLWASMIQIQN